MLTYPLPSQMYLSDDLVLWEFTSDDDADLGYTFSQPTIVMTKAGWMAIVGNGYNNSGDGTAKLFAIITLLIGVPLTIR